MIFLRPSREIECQFYLNFFVIFIPREFQLFMVQTFHYLYYPQSLEVKVPKSKFSSVCYSSEFAIGLNSNNGANADHAIESDNIEVCFSDLDDEIRFLSIHCQEKIKIIAAGETHAIIVTGLHFNYEAKD